VVPKFEWCIGKNLGGLWFKKLNGTVYWQKIGRVMVKKCNGVLEKILKGNG